jgi:predicted membrane protein
MTLENFRYVMLFILLILFFYNLNIVYRLYQSSYGKLLLIFLLIVFSFHTIYYGLVFLVIILLSVQSYHVEPLTPLEAPQKVKSKSSTKKQQKQEPKVNVNPLINSNNIQSFNSKKFSINKETFQVKQYLEPYTFSSFIKNSHSLIR